MLTTIIISLSERTLIRLGALWGKGHYFGYGTSDPLVDEGDDRLLVQLIGLEVSSQSFVGLWIVLPFYLFGSYRSYNIGHQVDFD